MKTIVTEMVGIKRWLDIAEGKISEVENVTGEKGHVIYRGTKIKMTSHFSLETMQVSKIFKVLKQTVKLEFYYFISQKQSEIKMLADTHKLKELISIRPTLQEMLQEILQAEGKR